MNLDFVPIGLAITLEPAPLAAFLVVLASERGIRKGAAFIFGWFLSLAVVIALTVLATGNRPPKPSTALSVAALVQPWPLVIAAAAIVAEAKVSSAETYISLILFCLIATSSVLVIEIHAAFRPERSRALLARIKTWVDTYMDQVIIIVSVLLGLWLIGKSSYVLAA